MIPIAIIAGVIGAVVSTAQGASWISDHLGSSKDTSSVGGKGQATSQTDTKTSPSFEAALAAQVTGQSVPTSMTSAKSSASSLTSVQQYGTSYDALERTQAGITAYSRVGEHQDSRASGSGSVSPS